MTNPVIDALFNAGAHIGFGRSRRHASVRSQIFGAKAGVDIIDITTTAKQLEAAKAEIAKAVATGRPVLFVGAKTEVADLITEAAQEAGMPFVASRWIGGTLTNWTEIKKRTSRMKDLEAMFAKGDLVEKYNKKERLMLARELKRLNADFGGIKSLEGAPSAMIIVDSKNEAIAATEASKVRVPVIALCGTDNDITKVSTPVVMNDASRASVKFFLDTMVEAVKAAKPAKKEVAVAA